VLVRLPNRLSYRLIESGSATRIWLLSPLRLPFRHPGIAVSSYIYEQTQRLLVESLSAGFQPFRLFRFSERSAKHSRLAGVPPLSKRSSRASGEVITKKRRVSAAPNAFAPQTFRWRCRLLESLFRRACRGRRPAFLRDRLQSDPTGRARGTRRCVSCGDRNTITNRSSLDRSYLGASAGGKRLHHICRNATSYGRVGGGSSVTPHATLCHASRPLTQRAPPGAGFVAGHQRSGAIAPSSLSRGERWEP
jgi:hypothetical protein